MQMSSPNAGHVGNVRWCLKPTHPPQSTMRKPFSIIIRYEKNWSHFRIGPGRTRYHLTEWTVHLTKHVAFWDGWGPTVHWNGLLSLKCKTSVACAIGPSVTTSSTDFSFQNLIFLEFIWIFNGRNHFLNQYLPHSESKSFFQINSN